VEKFCGLETAVLGYSRATSQVIAKFCRVNEAEKKAYYIAIAFCTTVFTAWMICFTKMQNFAEQFIQEEP